MVHVALIGHDALDLGSQGTVLTPAGHRRTGTGLPCSILCFGPKGSGISNTSLININ